MWCGLVVSNSNGHAGNIGNVETMCTSSLQQTNRPPPTAPTNHQPTTDNHQPINHQPTNHQPTPPSSAVDTNQQPPRTNHRHVKLSIPICHHHHAHGRDDVHIVSTNKPSANNCNTPNANRHKPTNHQTTNPNHHQTTNHYPSNPNTNTPAPTTTPP